MNEPCGKCRHNEADVNFCYACQNGPTRYGLFAPIVDDFGVSGSWIATENSSVDMVNRPPHYTHGKYECIDVMVDTFGKEAVQHFCVLNAFKYVWRSEHKNGLEDIKKAWRYLDIYLELEGEKDESGK